MNLGNIVLRIILISIVESIFVPSVFTRQVREGDNLEAKVQQIFDEIVTEKGYENVYLPLAIRNVFARLLSYNIPGKGEENLGIFDKKEFLK